ncbi:MAG: hypothetical protein DWB42_19645, partial [Chloroflexi bacterium]|nr:hypothetical protein [Chloroflexota bacterium]
APCRMLRRRKSPGKCWTGRKNAADPSTTPFQLLFLDETSLSLHPILRRCWMKRGQRKRIPAPGTPEFCHVFGAYNWRTGKTVKPSSPFSNISLSPFTPTSA